MRPLVYFVGFLVMMLAAVLIGEVVENVGGAFILAAFAGLGLAGLTEQIAQSVDD